MSDLILNNLFFLFLVLLLLSGLFYFMFMIFLLKGWWRIKKITGNETEDYVKISIIIPARNEEKNISSCLNSVLAQRYPSQYLQVIVVDDHSSDKTADIVQSYDTVKLIKLKEHLQEDMSQVVSYKKKAIETAVQNADGDLIITTDADCTAGKEWIASIVSFYNKTGAKMISGPVVFNTGKGFFQKFLSLDFASLIGIGAATLQNDFPTINNGANLVYEKKVFKEVEGYQRGDQIASKDDMVLMYKVHRIYPEKVLFLKSPDAIVYTDAPHNFKAFVAQRVRWVSKLSGFKNKNVVITGVCTYSFNFLLLSGVLISLIVPVLWKIIVLIFLVKVIMEFLFLWNVTGFLKRRELLWLFLPFQGVHLIYVVLSGLLSLRKRYIWKGRKVS